MLALIVRGAGVTGRRRKPLESIPEGHPLVSPPCLTPEEGRRLSRVADRREDPDSGGIEPEARKWLKAAERRAMAAAALYLNAVRQGE